MLENMALYIYQIFLLAILFIKYFYKIIHKYIMEIKFETWVDYLIFFIILVKIVFIISAIGHIIFSHSTSNKAKDIDHKLLYFKERTEFIFIISMSILLIYHFNPRFSKKPISSETSLLFFLFGWILIITSKWSLFIKEAPWYKQIVGNL